MLPFVKLFYYWISIVDRPNYGSKSEMEYEATTMKLVNDFDRVNRSSTQCSMKPHEIGPRMTLKLVKVEEGLSFGAIIFHEFGLFLASLSFFII